MAQRLGNVAVGTVLKLNEKGSPQNYIVVHQGKPSSMYDNSCNGTWLLRQNIWNTLAWSTDGSNFFNSSKTVNYHLDTDYLTKLDPSIQAVVKTVKIPYCVGGGGSHVNSGANGYSTKLFLLSGYEVGWTTSTVSYFPVDGAKLAYFKSGTGSSANNKRIAKLNGSAAIWWLRSPHTNNTYSVWHVFSNGDYDSVDADVSYGIRPAMVMPTDLIVDDNGNITANTVPTPPASITVPTSSVPAGSTIAVSWSAVSGASSYTLQRSVNGESWQTIQSNASTSYNDVAGAWTQVQYRVAAVASGFTSAYVSSTIVTVLPYTIDTLTVPSQIMQGQSVPISWSAVSLATNYILERNADSGGWTQIYSGSGTSYTDTPGDWTTVQYRVKAGANDVYGAYKTSASIPIISASALVISGSDSDLGTLVADVPYTVSTDTGNPITLTRKVNGILVATLTVQSGFAYSIPVMDLPTGSGTIEIGASVNTSSGGPVSATRTWTYTKTAITFPTTGGVAQLTLNGQNVFPPTLAESVRVPTVWGGSLDKALEQLLPVVNAAVISVGTYEGTGTFGVDNPNTLTFEDTPVVVTIYGGGQTLVISSTDTSSPAYISGNQAKWYSTVSAADQMNTDGVTYSYVAVAKGVTA